MKKLIYIIALLVLSATSLYAQQDMSNMSSMQMQSVQGVASTSDANRHYLMHLANLHSSGVTGVSNPTDAEIAITKAQEFNDWFLTAIEGFNEVQATITDPAVANARSAEFVKERDAQVEYYMNQQTGVLVTKLSPRGKTEIARYIAGTIPYMQSGVTKETYDRMMLTKAEKDSLLGNGGSSGGYNCSNPSFTCDISYSMAAAVNNSGSSVVTDTFNRANGGPGSNWTTDYGTFAIANNVITISNPGNNDMAYMHWSATYTANQLSQIKLTSLPASNGSLGVTVRFSSYGNCYAFQVYNNPTSGYTLVAYKIVAGVISNASYVTVPLAVGDTIGLQASGTTISAFYKGETVLQFEDSSLTTGQPGIAGNSGSGDDWTGGNVGNTLLFNPVIEGTQSMLSPPGGTLHTPSTFVTLNGIQQSQNGTAVCPACYIVASGSEAGNFLPGQTDTTNDGGQLLCSAAGVFLITNADNGYVENAQTYVKNTDPSHSQGGKVFVGGPDGAYEWQIPDKIFIPTLSDISSLYVWESFSTSPYVGYEYSVQNWCSNTGNAGQPPTPDADFTGFKVVLPEIYLSGGSWSAQPIASQGGLLIMDTFLWRLCSTCQWRTAPWFSPYAIVFGAASNAPWNSPSSRTWAQLAQDGIHTGFCSVTPVGLTSPYKVTVTSGNSCIEHNNHFNSDGNIIPCSH